ncbi:MAG TPA: HAMP domain-containing sensor histidine kinase, partial [Actinomycetota bacterium]|nr:HAMP domain-containing sensor histidine kinase [Actinomycetota bacterium]
QQRRTRGRANRARYAEAPAARRLSVPRPVRSSSGPALLPVIVAAVLSAGIAWIVATRRRRRVERAAAEASLEASRVKDALTNVKHEIGTPVTSILLAARILSSRKISAAERGKIVGKLTDSALRLERTVDLLVTYAALRGGARAVSKAHLDPASLAQASARRLGELHPGRRIVVRAGESVPAVAGDASLVRAALDQLVDNALKFSRSGEAVEIAVRAAPSSPGSCEIAVRDRGIGIAPADQARIFDEYDQLDGSATREFGGVGLGLAFVREVAGLHGGHVEVRSVPGAGSTFVLRFPPASSRPVVVRMRKRRVA